MINITHYQRNANENCNEASLHTGQNGYQLKKIQIVNTEKDVEMGTLLHCWWESKLIQSLWKSVWGFLKNLGRKLSYDPTIPKETIPERDTCASMFFPALLTVARTWKQSRC